jgi:hypothetical protein
MLRGLLTSKWASNDWGQSLAITLAVSLVILSAGMFIGSRMRRVIDIKGLITSLIVVTSLITVCVPIASGSYIKNRFNTVGGDFNGRLAHWKHAVELMQPGWETVAFGMGLGVFPRAYAWGSAVSGNKEGASIVQLQQEPLNTYLRLGATMDLTLGQRISLGAGQNYSLSIDVKAPAHQSKLGISICRRYILHPTLWNPTCLYYEKAIERRSGKWQTLRWNFNIGNIGDNFQIGRRPLVIRISNGLPHNEVASSVYRPIDCDNIALWNPQGDNLLINGDFGAGLDRWYLYTDFYHLPLHIKNLWATVYFEQGLFGLAAFGSLALYTIILGVRLSRRGDSFATILLASLLGFFSVGLIGTLLDVPRVSFLFFLLQFVLLAQDLAPISPMPKNSKLISAHSPQISRKSRSL